MDARIGDFADVEVTGGTYECLTGRVLHGSQDSYGCHVEIDGSKPTMAVGAVWVAWDDLRLVAG